MKNDRPNYVSVTQPVRVRRYDVDTDGLRKTLKNHKTKSISEIANELGVSETMVQHWFRNDECFSIPQPEIWPRLKAVLGIEADEFDDPIMTFDERDGVFEKGERIYLTNGVSPTLTAQTNGERIIELNSVEVLGLLDEDGYELSNRVYNQDGLAPSIRTYQGGGLQPKFVEVKQATSDGSISCMVGGVADLNYPTSKTRRGRVQDGGTVCPTLTTESIPSVLEDWLWEIDGEWYSIRIRKLTPRECWRLMDFTDEDFEKAESVNSNTQLYKQAGNSIVKNCMCEIFKGLMG